MGKLLKRVHWFLSLDTPVGPVYGWIWLVFCIVLGIFLGRDLSQISPG